MAEKSIFGARAVVYYFDSAKKTWTPTQVGNGFSRVDLYENPTNNSYRVIGRGLPDTSKVVINSNVTKEITYSRASETFHQWSDGRYVYGLNFASKEEAETFGTGFEDVVKKLKEGELAPKIPEPEPEPEPVVEEEPEPPKPEPPAPKPEPPVSRPEPPAKPEVPVARPEPPPSRPQPPETPAPKPEPPVSRPEPPVKPEVPVARPEPPAKAEPPKPEPPAPQQMAKAFGNKMQVPLRPHVADNKTPAKDKDTPKDLKTSVPVANSAPMDLAQFKEEILAETRKELKQMKEEILQALKR